MDVEKFYNSESTPRWRIAEKLVLFPGATEPAIITDDEVEARIQNIANRVGISVKTFRKEMSNPVATPINWPGVPQAIVDLEKEEAAEKLARESISPS